MQASNILQTEVLPETIDLGLGNPHPNLLSLEMLHRSADDFFTSRDVLHLQNDHERFGGYLG